MWFDLSHHLGDMLAHIYGVFKIAISMPQKQHISHPKHVRCRKLLTFTHSNHLFFGLFEFMGSFLAIGDDTIHHPITSLCQPCNGTGALSFLVIRMRRNNEDGLVVSGNHRVRSMESYNK